MKEPDQSNEELNEEIAELKKEHDSWLKRWNLLIKKCKEMDAYQNLKEKELEKEIHGEEQEAKTDE
jgi:hypothetical protein